MLRKVALGLAGLAATMFVGPAMAQVNPWAPAQTTVPVNINVGEMVELFTDVTAVNLQIVDAGENQGSAQAVARQVTHIHNVDVDVSVAIDDDIPDNTQFHILIEPDPVWTVFGSNGADKVVSWRREGGTYLAGATGGHPNQETVVGVGPTAIAFSRSANAPTQVGQPNATVDVQYFADARNFMPAVSNEGFNVLWTIAEQP